MTFLDNNTNGSYVSIPSIERVHINTSVFKDRIEIIYKIVNNSYSISYIGYPDETIAKFPEDKYEKHIYYPKRRKFKKVIIEGTYHQEQKAHIEFGDEKFILEDE